MRPGQGLPGPVRELYGVTLYTCIVGLLSYVTYIPLFLELGADRIAWTNVGVIVVFAGGIAAVVSGRVFTGMTAASIAVAVHAWLTALTLGGGAFELHVLLALELGLLFSYVRLWVRLAYAAIFITAYLGLLVALDRVPPTVPLSHEALHAFVLLNSGIFACITVLIATFYAWSVRRNRVARERVLAELEAHNERLRAAHDDLAVARDLAQEASKAKSMFLANMSHELRTPLNAIIGYSEMIEEDALEDGNAALAGEVGRIMGAGRHLLSLINDILDLAKIEARQMLCERIEFDLTALVASVIDTAQPLAAKGGNDLAHVVDPGIGPLHTDPTKVRQILLNLLSNACKFTEHGTVSLRVAAAARQGTEGIRIEVHDTGIGIPADKLEHIFGEFSQADDTTTRKFGGTGLGLAITERFAQMLGGTISVRSTVGEGSQFQVWLPRRLPDDAPVA